MAPHEGGRTAASQMQHTGLCLIPDGHFLDCHGLSDWRGEYYDASGRRPSAIFAFCRRLSAISRASLGANRTKTSAFKPENDVRPLHDDAHCICGQDLISHPWLNPQTKAARARSNMDLTHHKSSR